MPSEFDTHLAESFYDGTIPEFGDYVFINNQRIDAAVHDRSHTTLTITGGKSSEVTASVEMLTAAYLAAGGTFALPNQPFITLQITFSDGVVGRISSAADYGGLVTTLQVGPRLDGMKGPSGGLW
jgi:hypothetical protein